MDEFCCGYGEDKYCPTCGTERPDYIDPDTPFAGVTVGVDLAERNRREKIRYRVDAAHREVLKERSRKWAKQNPHKAKAKYQRHNSLKRGATISDFTASQWKRMLVVHGFKCFYCGILASDTPQRWLTQDHKIPLSRGGDHTETNIVPACQSCNSKKHSCTAEEFLAALKIG